MIERTERVGPLLELTAHRRTLKALTGVRFFAALYVVFYHTKLGPTLLEKGHPAVGHFFMSGYLAVSLFFLLSGFILAYTYAGQIAKPGDYRRFWEARFCRIWPVYAVSLLLTSLVHLAIPKGSYMIATLLMLQAWNPLDHGMWGAWNYVCWTLSVEAFFYLCFPFFQSFMEKLNAKWQLGHIVLMLAAAASLNSAVFVLGYTSHGSLDNIPLPLIRLPEFLIGVGLGNYYLLNHKASGQDKVSAAAGLWTYLSLPVTVALLCSARSAWTSTVVVSFAAFVFGLATEDTAVSRALSTKPLMLGGAISYSIYLLQAPLKDYVLGTLDRVGISSALPRMGIQIALLVGISLVAFELIEEPSRRKLRAIFASQERRRMSRSMQSVKT